MVHHMGIRRLVFIPIGLFSLPVSKLPDSILEPRVHKIGEQSTLQS